MLSWKTRAGSEKNSSFKGRMSAAGAAVLLLLLLLAVFGEDGFRSCEAFMPVCLDSDVTRSTKIESHICTTTEQVRFS